MRGSRDRLTEHRLLDLVRLRRNDHVYGQKRAHTAPCPSLTAPRCPARREDLASTSGARRRGLHGGVDSDLDFLVVEPEEDDGSEAVRLMRALRDLRVSADVIVVSERYAEEWREVRGRLVHAALSEGRVLTD